jgi:hypothetical protein
VAIKVTFVDEGGAQVAESNMAAEQLPASFARPTTLHLKGEAWSVLRAEPAAAEDFVAAGELKLVVRRLEAQTVPLDKVLYSLPTICDEIPGVLAGSARAGKQVLEIHEDEWRQVELVSPPNEVAVRRCFDEIAKIFKDERAPSGAFLRLHVRTEVADPLVGVELKIDTALAHFPGARSLEGMSYEGGHGVIEGGFAFQTAHGLAMYGHARDGFVDALGITGEPDERDAPALAALMTVEELKLVDWCAMKIVAADERDLRLYLRGA